MHIKLAFFAYIFDSKPLQITHFLNAINLSIVQTLLESSIQNKREVCMEFNASLTIYIMFVFLCILTSTLQSKPFICCLSYIKCTQNMHLIRLCMFIYDYNAEELASLSLFMEINGFSHSIYRFLSLFFYKSAETGQLREVEWDQDMNQALLEPGILCHEYMLHKPSTL